MCTKRGAAVIFRSSPDPRHSFKIANSGFTCNNGDKIETSASVSFTSHASFIIRVTRHLSRRSRALTDAHVAGDVRDAKLPRVVVVPRARVQVRVRSHRSRDVHGIRATRSHGSPGVGRRRRSRDSIPRRSPRRRRRHAGTRNPDPLPVVPRRARSDRGVGARARARRRR